MVTETRHSEDVIIKNIDNSFNFNCLRFPFWVVFKIQKSQYPLYLTFLCDFFRNNKRN